MGRASFTYINSPISMVQKLEIKFRLLISLLPSIPHHHHRLQSLRVQRHTVRQIETVPPLLPRLRRQHAVRESKVKRHGIVARSTFLATATSSRRCRDRGRLGRILAEVLPARGASEAMLREGGGGVIWRWGAKILLWWMNVRLFLLFLLGLMIVGV